jgi:hypothetical protein
MTSNFKKNRVCKYYGNEFSDRTTVLKYCSDNCAILLLLQNRKKYELKKVMMNICCQNTTGCGIIAKGISYCHGSDYTS